MERTRRRLPGEGGRAEARRQRMGVVLLAALAAGCGGSLTERRARDPWTTDTVPGDPEGPEVSLDGSLQRYVAYAMARSPELRADYERWRAAVASIAPARRLPDPMVSFGLYLRSVETRVGPQRFRAGLRQSVPWPTRLTEAAERQSHRALAAARRLEARALAIEARVAAAYWRLWRLQQHHGVANAHQEILESLEEVVRARQAVGGAEGADVLQIQLSLARLRDHHGKHAEAIARAEADLREALGAPSDLSLPIDTSGEPPRLAAQPAEAPLLEALAEHPSLEAVAQMARAMEAEARRRDSLRMPDVTFGLDWIETGEASAGDPPDSGKDAVVLGVGVRVPLWQGAYAEEAESARAEARALQADREAQDVRLRAALQRALADLRDAERRVRLYERDLVPMAEATLRQVQAAYSVGRATVAQLLVAERDLLTLRDEWVHARSQVGIAVARLRALVGRPLESFPTRPWPQWSESTRGDAHRHGPTPPSAFSADEAANPQPEDSTTPQPTEDSDHE